jgi:hypothetical protein
VKKVEANVKVIYTKRFSTLNGARRISVELFVLLDFTRARLPEHATPSCITHSEPSGSYMYHLV